MNDLTDNQPPQNVLYTHIIVAAVQKTKKNRWGSG
jgi:hypothetical protein